MTAPSSSEKPMIEHALEYLALGYPVFPVCSPLMGTHRHRIDGQIKDCTPDRRGKNPMTAWKDFQTRLPTAAEVRSWWARWPNANIGMATGELSGVIVLDCDSGEARQSALDRGGLEKAPAVWTGTPGGIHFWIEHPGYAVKNFVKLIEGTDFRGDGGYVLLPPSLHYKGARYRWNEHTLGRKPPPVPPWLEPSLNGRGGDGSGSSSGERFDLSVILEGIPQGQRDTTLWSYAGKLRGDNVPIEYAEQMIRQAARLCKPAFDEDAAVEKVRRAYEIYPPNDDLPDFELDDLASGPLRVAGTEPATPILPDDAPSPWLVYDAADFLKIEYPVVQWRVEGFLREQAILFNFGAPGSIKTYIATDAAIAIATGGLFLGSYPCQRGRVLIVQEDTLDSDFQQAYLGPLVRARGVDPEELRGHLFVAPPGGMSLDAPSRLQDLCAWLEAQKPDLLIIDAFYLMHEGEGYGKDLGPIMKRIKALRTKYGCAIWIIDHDRKGKGDGNSSENPIDRLWGGRQKSAAVDAIMESRPVKGSHGETFLDVIKLRGAKPAEPIRVKLYPDYRLLVEGEGEAEEQSPTGTKWTVYEWLCREGGSRTKAQMSNGVNLSLRAVEGALYDLARDGLAKKAGKHGRAETWIALRKGDAEPQADAHFAIFDENEDE